LQKEFANKLEFVFPIENFIW